MPLAITRVPPEIAFDVIYQGISLHIYHAYEEDIQKNKIHGVYTADKNEGVRVGQREVPGVIGEHGFTQDEDRNDFFFNTFALFKLMKDFPEFKNKAGVHGSTDSTYHFQWLESYIVQVAIDNALIGFDEDFRFVDTTMIEESIESCTGGSIHPYPYEIKKVSDG